MAVMLVINPETDDATGALSGGSHWLVAPGTDADTLYGTLLKCLNDGVAGEVEVVMPSIPDARMRLLINHSVLLTVAVVETAAEDPPPSQARGRRTAAR